MWENQAEQKFVAILESIYEEYVVNGFIMPLGNVSVDMPLMSAKLRRLIGETPPAYRRNSVGLSAKLRRLIGETPPAYRRNSGAVLVSRSGQLYKKGYVWKCSGHSPFAL